MNVNDRLGRYEPELFRTLFADLQSQGSTARTDPFFIAQGMDDFVPLEILRKDFPPCLLPLRNRGIGLDLVEQESLLGILFLALPALRTKDKPL